MNNETNKIPEEQEQKTQKKPIKSYIFLILSLGILLYSSLMYNKYVVKSKDIPIQKLENNKHAINSKDNIIPIVLFVPNDSLSKLKSINTDLTVTITSDEISSIFDLIKEKSINASVIDPDVKLLNSYIIEDKLYLNLSANVISTIHSKHQELLLIYSLVNTYTSLNGIKKVKILVNDSEVDKMKWYNLRTFYTKNSDI